jgi:hypothetical protein
MAILSLERIELSDKVNGALWEKGWCPALHNSPSMQYWRHRCVTCHTLYFSAAFARDLHYPVDWHLPKPRRWFVSLHLWWWHLQPWACLHEVFIEPQWLCYFREIVLNTRFHIDADVSGRFNAKQSVLTLWHTHVITISCCWLKRFKKLLTRPGFRCSEMWSPFNQMPRTLTPTIFYRKHKLIGIILNTEYSPTFD